MNRRERITDNLTTHFTPSHLEVIDESHKHAGHAGARPEGETHYRIIIQADIFSGKSHVDSHRMINEALKSEFDNGLHALSIKIKKF